MISFPAIYIVLVFILVVLVHLAGQMYEREKWNDLIKKGILPTPAKTKSPVEYVPDDYTR